MRAVERLPEEAYAVLDRLDEKMISDELAGLIEYGAQELIYSFKIEGRDITGLSWPGAKALARWMAEKGHPLDPSEKDITDDEEAWYADVKMVDGGTGLGFWGTSKAKKLKKLRSGEERPDEHARTIALNKAQRNAICAHVPDKWIAQFIKQAIEEGKVRHVPPDEVESHRPRKPVDSEEVRRIREQAKWDREERLTRERAEASEEHEPIEEGPPRSVEEVREQLAEHIVGIEEWIIVSDRSDYFRVGKRKRLGEEMEYTVDELVRQMGGAWDREENCWRIPRGIEA